MSTKTDKKPDDVAAKTRELIACIDSQPTRAKQIAAELLAVLPEEEGS